MVRFDSTVVVALLAAAAVTPRLAAQDKPNLEKYVTIAPGTLPIILSAPHGGRSLVPGIPMRKGTGVEKFVVVRDENTLELAEKLTASIEKELGGKPYVVFAKFDRKQLDANRPPEGAFEVEDVRPYYSAYHKALADACTEVRKTWGRGLLIDIHGQAMMVDTIYRGTQNLQSVADLKKRFGMAAINGPKSIFGVLEAKEYTVFPPSSARDPAKENPWFNGGYIVETYGSNAGTGIDAMQLEFGVKARMRMNLDQTATDVAGAVGVFAKEYLPAEKLPKRK